jgi:hypothetical protein
MGDRCYLYVTVEKARAKEFCDIVFGCETGPEHEGEFHVSYEVQEVNWGAFEERKGAAEAGILFYGHHGAGGEYEPVAFCGGDGKLNEADTGTDSRFVLYADEDGDISRDAQDRLKHFISVYKEVKERIHNPLYALIHAPCT